MSDNLNIAVPLYIGYGLTKYPKEDVSRLIDKFGPEVGVQLASEVNSLIEELGVLKPDWNIHSLQSATTWAVGVLKHKHPELDSNAVAALAWIYSWGWK